MSDPETQARQAIAIADAEIQNLEAQRDVVRQQLAGASGEAADAVALTLTAVEDKLAASRARRASIAARAARVERMAKLTAELVDVRAALEPLLASGDRGARFEALRRRAAVLQAEAEALKAAPR